MKLIMVAATSQDGYLTKGNEPDPRSWTSNEDKKHLTSLINQHPMQIMGSTTYKTFESDPVDGILKLVITRTPQDYSDKQVEGELEFISLSPQEIIDTYSDEQDSCLVLGGSYIYTSYLDAGVIDEIYLTVEPVKHGDGVSLLRDGKTIDDYKLPDPETTRLNDKGTLLKHYVLKK